MKKYRFDCQIYLMLVTALFCTFSSAQEKTPIIEFPVDPLIFADDPFNSCEGIGFNGQGQMFATCNQGLWRIDTSAKATLIADLESNLGKV